MNLYLSICITIGYRFGNRVNFSSQGIAVYFMQEYTNVQLHGFADVLQRAYGACIYMRSQNFKEIVEVKLLYAKSKVAPLKQQTIPRLELCAGLTFARLVAKVVQSLRMLSIKSLVGVTPQ